MLHPPSDVVWIIDQLTDKSAYRVRGRWHRALNRGAQADSFAQLSRPAAHQIGRWELPADVWQRGQDSDGIHPVSVELPTSNIIRADIQDHQLTGRPGSGASIDQHQGGIALEQVIRQVHAADAVVDEPRLRR